MDLDKLYGHLKQDRMKKTLACVIIISLICFSCILNKANTLKDDDKIIGLWTEHWGNGSFEPETDVNYVDTLKIGLNDRGKINIICINNSNYVYSNIIYKGSKLLFQMENKTDPKEKFIIQYSLMLTEENVFIGEINNSRGKKVSINLKKHTKNAL